MNPLKPLGVFIASATMMGAAGCLNESSPIPAKNNPADTINVQTYIDRYQGETPEPVRMPVLKDSSGKEFIKIQVPGSTVTNNPSDTGRVTVFKELDGDNVVAATEKNSGHYSSTDLFVMWYAYHTLLGANAANYHASNSTRSPSYHGYYELDKQPVQTSRQRYTNHITARQQQMRERQQQARTPLRNAALAQKTYNFRARLQQQAHVNRNRAQFRSNTALTRNYNSRNTTSRTFTTTRNTSTMRSNSTMRSSTMRSSSSSSFRSSSTSRPR